jgi:DICT domain-containing protein
LDGLGATIGRCGPHTKVIPGHGPVTDRNALVAQRDLLIAVRDKVAAMIAQNKTLDEVIAAKPTADFDAQVPQGTQTSERFVSWLYAEIKAAQAPPGRY